MQFRFTTVTRRTQHKLDQVLDRIHVLEGRMIVLLNVDKVIKIIRNADDPKADLIKAFKLTERQAEDILEMRLRMLAKLEHIKVEQELDGQAQGAEGPGEDSRQPQGAGGSGGRARSKTTSRPSATSAAPRSKRRRRPRSRRR